MQINVRHLCVQSTHPHPTTKNTESLVSHTTLKVTLWRHYLTLREWHYIRYRDYGGWRWTCHHDNYHKLLYAQTQKNSGLGYFKR